MKKNNLIWTFLIFIFCFSCKQKTDTAENESQKVENNTTITEKQNFPVVMAECDGFGKSIKYQKKGPTLSFKIKYKNNTSSKITKFDLIYFAKAKFQDGTVTYYPTLNFKSDIEDDDKRFSENYKNAKQSLNNDEIWLPNTERQFEFEIFESLMSDVKNEILENEFKRTPVEFNLITRYNAISIDGEYTETFSQDILEFWKNHQKELGLR